MTKRASHSHRGSRRRRTRSVIAVSAVAASVVVGAFGLAVDRDSSATESSSRSPLVRATLEPLPVEPTTRPTPRASPRVDPTPVAIPPSGRGTFTVADGTSPAVGSGRLTSYQVEVEDGLPIKAASFAGRVDRTLGDPRGWTKDGAHAFRRQQSAPLRIVLASPATTDRLCAPLQTRGKVSCRNGNVVAINAVRWVEGASSYGSDLSGYRHYVINHEVGHSLGLNHAACPQPGADAPVMLQQTLGLQGCTKNPWP